MKQPTNSSASFRMSNWWYDYIQTTFTPACTDVCLCESSLWATRVYTGKTKNTKSPFAEVQKPIRAVRLRSMIGLMRNHDLDQERANVSNLCCPSVALTHRVQQNLHTYTTVALLPAPQMFSNRLQTLMNNSGLVRSSGPTSSNTRTGGCLLFAAWPLHGTEWACCY